MSKYVVLSMIVTVCVFGSVGQSRAAVIQWNAIDLQGAKIPNAVVEVISDSVILARGLTTPGAALNRLSFNSSLLRGSEAAVTLRFRANGREEASLFNVAGDADHLISVVLPEVYGGAKPTCEPPCRPRCRWFSRWR